MAIDTGEDVFDALLALGYVVEITDEGSVTATDGARTLRGKAEQGRVEWSDRSLTYRVLHDAYIAKLRGRIQAAQRVRPAPPPDEVATGA